MNETQLEAFLTDTVKGGEWASLASAPSEAYLVQVLQQPSSPAALGALFATLNRLPESAPTLMRALDKAQPDIQLFSFVVEQLALTWAASQTEIVSLCITRADLPPSLLPLVKLWCNIAKCLANEHVTWSLSPAEVALPQVRAAVAVYLEWIALDRHPLNGSLMEDAQESLAGLKVALGGFDAALSLEDGRRDVLVSFLSSGAVRFFRFLSLFWPFLLTHFLFYRLFSHRFCARLLRLHSARAGLTLSNTAPPSSFSLKPFTHSKNSPGSPTFTFSPSAATSSLSTANSYSFTTSMPTAC